MWENPDKMTGLGQYHMSAIGRYFSGGPEQPLWSPLESENTVGSGHLVKHLRDESFPLECNWWKSINSATGKGRRQLELRGSNSWPNKA